MQSNRATDTKVEKLYSQFLDMYFYPQLMSDFKDIKDAKRAYDYETQISGVDVDITMKDDSHMYIDEKVAAYYANKQLDTYSFELYFTGRSAERYGWFINDELKTNKYVLVYPRVRAGIAMEYMELDDILGVDIIVIGKKKLKSYLNSRNITKSYMLSIVDYMNNSRSVSYVPIHGTKVAYFHRSNKFPESPINLIVKKSKLAELATAVYTVDKSGAVRVSPESLNS